MIKLSFSFASLLFILGACDTHSPQSTQESLPEKVRYSLKNEPVDVVIPSTWKDQETLEHCIDGIRKNGQNIRRVIVVSSERLTDSAEWFDEKNFPFTKEDIAFQIFGDENQSHNYIQSKNNRLGWIYQQLIKLYALEVIPDISSNVLILDSDTIFLKPVSFVDLNGEASYSIASEYHLPYFDHMKRVIPWLRKVKPDYSGVTHHMLFQKAIMDDLFDQIRAHQKTEPWKALCNSIDPNEAFGSGISEYEIYFNFALLRTDQIHIRPLDMLNIASLDQIDLLKQQGYSYVSCHSYLRKDPQIDRPKKKEAQEPLETPRDTALHESLRVSEVENTKTALMTEGWSSSLFALDPTCPRILVASTENGGIGHRFSALVQSLLLANSTNSTLIVPNSFWRAGRAQSMTDNYDWMPDFLGTTGFIPSSLSTPQIPEHKFNQREEWFNAINRDKCHIRGLAMVGHGHFCEGDYCDNVWKHCYRHARSILLKMFKLSLDPSIQKRLVPLFQHTQNRVIVSWHVRIGDIVLQNDAALKTLLVQLNQDALQRGIELEHHVFSQNPICIEGGTLFCGFEKDLKATGNAHFHINISEKESLQHMIYSDVLVATGSSFPLVAAELSDHSQLVLMFTPKEGSNSIEVYSRSDDVVLVNENGEIIHKQSFEENLAKRLSSGTRPQDAPHDSEKENRI